ncbi:hypothetical protein ATO7_09727 [Oceanococcus atlanticus]|uniref:DUF445 domain-containing protein n=1 Tax=Oceanococcus atlanticus TaxID=1317117 RepID=A0A1Y1SEF0_9GAMM|nr:hypothetical protein [Oceanococcus atlanticus]ORE87311.1 hypothetical protein ATO7_09727 [Oceanococcus atlanticus]
MFEAAWSDFQANMWLYLSMPITSGLVGYVTNVVAIKMMFHPLEFFGKPPFLGWQGIVPRKAGKMATIACNTIVPQLVSEQEIFERLDPKQVTEEISGPILELVDQIVEEVMYEYEPALWETLPVTAKNLIIKRVKDDAPEVVEAVMASLRDNVTEMFDLTDMVVTTLARDKQLINKIFQETGRREFQFIGHSGFYFGFIFGVIQMVAWTFYKGDYQLPLFGLAVGYLTNFIALKLIFRPQTPIKIGGLRIQGLFHKRQPEVSRDYAKLIADEIVTPSNIIEAVLKGPYADRVFHMIAKHVKRVIDAQSGMAKPFVAWTIGTKRYIDMKNLAVERIVEKLPDTVRSVDAYATEAMDIANTLSGRLSDLPPDEFEEMLRPAFEEDEWILIAVGAALGFCVGIGQLIAFKALASVPAISSEAVQQMLSLTTLF